MSELLTLYWKLFASNVGTSLLNKYEEFINDHFSKANVVQFRRIISHLISTAENDYREELRNNKSLRKALRLSLLENLLPKLCLDFSNHQKTEEHVDFLNYLIDACPYFDKANFSNFFEKEISKHLGLFQEENNPGVHYEFITADESLDLFLTGCSGDGSRGQAEVAATISKHCKKTPSLLLLTGDTVYPSISFKTKARDLNPFFSPYQDLGMNHVFAALGNHESGAITPLPGHSAAHADQELLLKRRDHAVELISQQPGIHCQPYYSISCKEFGKSLPYLKIIVIDSTTLPFDQAQQEWLKQIAEESKAKNTLLVSHHAIGETLGKRNLTRSERHLYGSYTTTAGKKIVGNHHKVLAQVFQDLGLMEHLKTWTSAVAHDHFLAYVDQHPQYGNVIFSGGGSPNERTSPNYMLPGQQFPALNIKQQEKENKKAKSGGFAKLAIKEARLNELSIISGKNEKLYEHWYQTSYQNKEELSITEMKEILTTIMGDYLQRGIVRYLLNPVFRFITFFKYGHQHNNRAESLIAAINSTDLTGFDDLKVLIDEQITLVEQAIAKQNNLAVYTTPNNNQIHTTTQASDSPNLVVKYRDNLKCATQGGYYTQLLTARAFLHQYDEQAIQPSEDISACLS